jgi:hypothetical protein
MELASRQEIAWLFQQSFNGSMHVDSEIEETEIINYDQLENEFNKRMAIQSTSNQSYKTFLD